MGISLTVKGQRELQKLANDLRRAKGTLRQELVRAFREGGKETLKRVKHNIETMTIRGYRTGGAPLFEKKMPGTNIRRRISRVTELDISSSSQNPRVKFQVRTDRLGDASEVPYHLDSGRVFRHPIMGNRSGNWAGNSGKPWFYDEIKKDIDIFNEQCDQAIDRTVESLEKG